MTKSLWSGRFRSDKCAKIIRARIQDGKTIIRIESLCILVNIWMDQSINSIVEIANWHWLCVISSIHPNIIFTRIDRRGIQTIVSKTLKKNLPTFYRIITFYLFSTVILFSHNSSPGIEKSIFHSWKVFNHFCKIHLDNIRIEYYIEGITLDKSY